MSEAFSSGVHELRDNDYSVLPEDLNAFFTDKDQSALRRWGGVAGLARLLESDPSAGLESEQVARSKTAFGPNVLPDPQVRTFFSFLLESIKDPILIVLIIAAVVSVIVGVIPEKDRSHGWIEGLAILLAVAIVSLVTAVLDWTKQRRFLELEAVDNSEEVTVTRSHMDMQIMNTDIVVGDIVHLRTGDSIQADGLYIDGYDLKTDESSMTGETDMVTKSAGKPFLLSGTTINVGLGRMLVTNVGVNSQWGLTLAQLPPQSRPDTPLQEKLAGVAALIGKIGMVVAVVTFLALLGFWIIGVVVFIEQEGESFNFFWIFTTPDDIPFANGLSPVNFFIIAVTIIVVAVPEGLPLAVTISLGFSMRRMLKDNNLVRNLQSCETLGGATTICSDKTGTLTENRMTVVEGWFAGRMYQAVPTPAQVPSIVSLLQEGIAINSTCLLDLTNPERVEFVGSKTEGALLVLAQDFGGDYVAIRQDAQVVKLFPFSSTLKQMVTVVRTHLGFRQYTKGASEIVLGQCTHYLEHDGTEQPMDETKVSELQDAIYQMAQRSLRTICLAYRDHETDEFVHGASIPQGNLVCYAITGIKDPIRQGVAEAVATCARSGIRVRMVTGDNLTTATAVARECGILAPEDSEAESTIEGPVLRRLTDDELDARLPQLLVVARSAPLDKMRLVQRLNVAGEVVAVTGDGTNDAPALSKAHVGLAMGIAGTAVARRASDIVIMDDNFASIVVGIKWGRCVYDNIRKFLQFQLTINLVALAVAFLGAITGQGLPLTAVQLLWVNLIMDSLAALALGTELPTDELLERKPYGRHQPLISDFMWRNIIGHFLLQLAIILAILYSSSLPRAADFGRCGTDAVTYDISPYDAQAFCHAANRMPIPERACLLSDKAFRSAYETRIVSRMSDGGQYPTTLAELKALTCRDARHVLTFVDEVRQRYMYTIIFNAFVLLQVFNIPNARKLFCEVNPFNHFFTNRYIVFVLLGIILSQVLIVFIGGEAFSVIRLDVWGWLLCLVVGSTELVWGLVVRRIHPRHIPLLPGRELTAEQVSRYKARHRQHALGLTGDSDADADAEAGPLGLAGGHDADSLVDTSY